MANKDLNKLFEQDNKRINDSVKSELNHKINNTIKHKPFVKGVILITVALIGAAIFSWSLGLVVV